MKVKNPHNQKIEILYKGATYSVDAFGETGGIPEEVAEYWKAMIHNFVEIGPDTLVAPKEEAPKGSFENPMNYDEAVESMGKETVEKIVTEAIKIENPQTAAKKTAKKVATK